MSSSLMFLTDVFVDVDILKIFANTKICQEITIQRIQKLHY